ncbi:hypothetical protein B1207_08455 [Legionella quinlivanii]|uniref:N-acetyltransferase domain-containing protein n=1 Tax=Legionella quinlivanii TaxID=45073 RepID=A0A364LID2_9GAMM|nr:GNAT family N-acetyltransferase [Legionella quinlivanii]RAP36175.1 hypothetical protein B1207_08455 [Legionella quinlivanii]
MKSILHSLKRNEKTSLKRKDTTPESIGTEKKAKLSPVIRAYEAKDRSSVQQIIANGLNTTEESPMCEKIRKHLDTFDSQSKENWPQFNQRFWVAILDDKVVGCAGLMRTTYQPKDAKKMVTLHHLSVAAEFRRNGIGHALMNHIEEYCKTQQISRLRVTTQVDLEPAMSFYESRGYHITENKSKTVTKSNKGLVRYELQTFKPLIENAEIMSQLGVFNTQSPVSTVNSFKETPEKGLYQL